MSTHQGVTLRIGCRQPLTEAQVVEQVEASFRGELVPLSPGRWRLNRGQQGWLEQMVTQRHGWAKGQAWQVDWLLSGEGQAEAKRRGRYLGEPWMLGVAQALLAAGGAAVVSLTRGEGWEEGSIEQLEALDLPGFEGALLLSAPVAKAVHSLDLSGWSAREVDGAALWLVTAGWFAANAWGSRPAQGAPASLPWLRPLSARGLEEEEGEELLVVDAFGAASKTGDGDQADVVREAREGLSRFWRELEVRGGALAGRVRVVFAGGEHGEVDERTLRLALCAQHRRQFGEWLEIGVADLLNADAEVAAQLQWQMLGVVDWEMPQGQGRLVWSQSVGRRRVSLAFSREVAEGQLAWRGEGWQLAWIAALARSFVGLDVIGAGHLAGWLPRFLEDVDSDQFALVMCRGEDGRWSARCEGGWFGCGEGGRRWHVEARAAPAARR